MTSIYNSNPNMHVKPMYVRLADMLEQLIRQGQFQPGSQMPTEVGLAHDYNVSSGTVRKAIEELDDRGLVDRRQGRGTYVRDPQDVPLKVALSREQATALLDVFTAAAPKNGLEPVPLCLVNFELALTEYVHGPVTKVVTAKVKPSTKTSK